MILLGQINKTRMHLCGSLIFLYHSRKRFPTVQQNASVQELNQTQTNENPGEKNTRLQDESQNFKVQSVRRIYRI
jgi:hypothetical protein